MKRFLYWQIDWKNIKEKKIQSKNNNKSMLKLKIIAKLFLTRYHKIHMIFHKEFASKYHDVRLTFTIMTRDAVVRGHKTLQRE